MYFSPFLSLHRFDDNSNVLVNVNEIKSVFEAPYNGNTRCTAISFIDSTNSWMYVSESVSKIENLLKEMMNNG